MARSTSFAPARPANGPANGPNAGKTLPRVSLCSSTCTLPKTFSIICLDTYMLIGVYKERGIRLRNHRGAEPPRHLEPAGLVRTVGGRDRAPTPYAADNRVQAPARAARGRFRGSHGGRTAPPLPVEAGTTSGVRCLAGPIPPLLVRSRRCSRTPPRPHGAVNTNESEKEDEMTRQRPRIENTRKP